MGANRDLNELVERCARANARGRVWGFVRTFPTGRPPDRVRIPKSLSALAEISAIYQLAATNAAW